MVVRVRKIDPLFRFPSLNNIVHNIINANLCDFFLVASFYRSSYGVAYSLRELVQRTSLLINGVYLYSLVLYTWSVFASQWYVHLLAGVSHKN